MSFTTKVKNEITMASVVEPEKIALLCGFVRNNAMKSYDKLVLTSENERITSYLQMLLGSIKDVICELTISENNHFSKNKLYILTIGGNIEYLSNMLCIEKECPDLDVVSGSEESKSYLRGVFLATGSINDPKTSRYHMELFISDPMEAVFVQKVLNQFDLNAKLLTRDKGYMIYLKEAEKISDFLKLLGTTKSILYYEDIRAYHEHKNQTNRLNNCEQANIDRVVETATKQLAYIQVLEENLAVELLDEKTYEALVYRVKYPEASLKELSEIISLETGKKITKSGLNHRFRKIKELAENIINSK